MGAVLNPPAIVALEQRLAATLASILAGGPRLGRPELIEVASRQAEELFQGYSKSAVSSHDAYLAARAFLRGAPLDASLCDLVASALSAPISEQQGRRALGDRRFPVLLAHYENEARAGELWRLTWYGLLSSYFSIELDRASGDERRGWAHLREFLQRTWPMVDRASAGRVVPDWMKALRNDPDVLAPDPAGRFAAAVLAGEKEVLVRLATDLGIPQSSWFWHALVLGAVRSAAGQSDDAFRRHIPRLIALIEEYPVFRDDAIESILLRYHRSASHPVHPELRDFVVRKDVWRNPKLKAAGIATAWNRVPEAVWRMVLAWVNEGNLRDFFDILAARNQADEGRLAFWSRYMKQITWTRLVFGADTLALQKSDLHIRNLIAREEGAYAVLTANDSVDAFMMEIGDYIVVEFSQKPNAAYVYPTSQLRFDRHRKHYSGGTNDLKYGYYASEVLRIIHKVHWQANAEWDLKRLGIAPDPEAGKGGAWTKSAEPKVAQAPPSPWPAKASEPAPRPIPPVRPRTEGPPSIAELQAVIRDYPDVRIDDRRGPKGGRLWVFDPWMNIELKTRVQALGFKWAGTKSGWYYPEN